MSNCVAVRLSATRQVSELAQKKHRLPRLGKTGAPAYRKDGASITQFEDFFTSQVKGSPAVLSLLYNDAQAKLLWKVTWSRDGQQYELYVEDVKTRKGDPTRSPDSIIALASSITPPAVQ